MSDLADRVERAVRRGIAARTQYFNAINLPDEQALGAPADAEAITRIEKRMGIRLPPSYREFLLMFDGWRMIDGGVDLFAVDDLLGGETYRAVRLWQARAGERGDVVASRSLAIGQSSITPTKYLLDPDVRDATGEWQLVQHHDGEEAVVQSFILWLEQSVDEYLELARNPLD